VPLTLLHREDCELCDQMLADLESLVRTLPPQLRLPSIEVVDVDSDPELSRRHGLHVPVLLLDGTVVCRHRLDSAELQRLLRNRAPPPD